MEAHLSPLRHYDTQFAFGMLTDTPPLQLIPVIDIDKQPLLIPCTSPNTTMQQLLTQYKFNTGCLTLFKGSPHFLIQQGKQTAQIALPDDTLANLQLDYNQICFVLIDSGVQNVKGLTQKAHKQSGQKQKCEFQIKIQFESKKYQMKINLKNKVIILKKQLIEKIPPLANKTPDLINLMHKGLFLTDDTVQLSTYNVTEDSVFFVKIKKKEGCFSGDTKVMMGSGMERRIQEIKIGDQILAFNEERQKFEVDHVIFVERTFVTEAIHIELENGTKVITTPNHYFMCQDKQYRCCTAKQQNDVNGKVLTEGTSLKLSTGSSSKIISILNRPVSTSSPFYHLSIKQNHNFTTNSLIAHNMFLNIKLPSEQFFKVNTSPLQQMITIKEKIEEQYFINIHNQQLFYIGQELDNEQTIADKMIPKDSTLVLMFKQLDCFNLVKHGTPILMKDGKEKMVQNLKTGDQIASYDPDIHKMTTHGEQIDLIQKVENKDFIVINIDDYQHKNELTLSADSYLQFQNGQLKNIRDLCYNYYLEQLPKIRKMNNKLCTIKAFAHDNKRVHDKPFYRITTLNTRNFIAQQIIIHKSFVNVIVKRGEERVKRFTFATNSKDTIGGLRDKISQIGGHYVEEMGNIDIGKLRFILNEEELMDKSTLQELQIKGHLTIIAEVQKTAQKIGKSVKSSILITTPLAPTHIQSKLIEIQVSRTQKYPVRYIQYRQKTVEQIIKEILPNSNSFYFFIFSHLILFPTDLLSRLEHQTQQFTKHNDITILMVKNQKFAFLQKMNIKREDIKNYSSIKNKDEPNFMVSGISQIAINEQDLMINTEIRAACQRIINDKNITISAFKQEKFFKPFLYLTSRKYHHKMFQYIKNFQKYSQEYSNQHSVFTIIKDVYINTQLLTNYYGYCFLGFKNFMFSRYFKQNNTFYFHNFTIAFKMMNKVEKELSQTPGVGTLFRIKSLNGRQISKFSLYPDQQEVIFLPFTHFLVQKIIKKADYDEVFLAELSSPISFHKDIVLWVDDQPTNNLAQIRQIYSHFDIQILQATSTLEALKWIQQFGWLLNWKGLEFKLISDMQRVEGIGKQQKNNDRAGIDLLIELYNNHGITSKTLIFCGNVQRGLKMAKQADINKDRYEITKSANALMDFIKKKHK